MSTIPNPGTSPGVLRHFPQTTFLPFLCSPGLPTQHHGEEEQRVVSSAHGLDAKAVSVGTRQATAERECQPFP